MSIGDRLVLSPHALMRPPSAPKVCAVFERPARAGDG